MDGWSIALHDEDPPLSIKTRRDVFFNIFKGNRQTWMKRIE
jgi:hypothetical protein